MRDVEAQRQTVKRLIDRRDAILAFVDRCRERGEEPVSELEDVAVLDMQIAMCTGGTLP